MKTIRTLYFPGLSKSYIQDFCDSALTVSQGVKIYLGVGEASTGHKRKDWERESNMCRLLNVECELRLRRMEKGCDEKGSVTGQS
jgi:hypothetical protein